jgi:hypothetical protein
VSELFVVSATLIEDREFSRQPGTSCDAPYVEAIVTPVGGCRSVQSASFKARLDTGADITVVPESVVEGLLPLLLGRPLQVRGHDGSVKRARTYLLRVTVLGWPRESEAETYRPERGVLLTDSDVGLIGMDIISRHWDVEFTRQRFSVISDLEVDVDDG